MNESRLQTILLALLLVLLAASSFKDRREQQRFIPWGGGNGSYSDVVLDSTTGQACIAVPQSFDKPDPKIPESYFPHCKDLR